MAVQKLICIGCPMGCALSVEMQGDEVLHVSGNTCPRGDAYARKEMTNPTRIVTSTVRVEGREMLSVKTEYGIPKGKIMDCIRELKSICVAAPVHIGDIIIENTADTGVSVIATKEILQRDKGDRDYDDYEIMIERREDSDTGYRTEDIL